MHLAILGLVPVAAMGQEAPSSTHFPPQLALGGALWNARTAPAGGQAIPVVQPVTLDVSVSRLDYPIASVEMLVDGRRLRAEHRYDTVEAAAVQRTFTLDPGDLPPATGDDVEVTVIARDTEADPMATDPTDPDVIGISVERFRVLVPRRVYHAQHWTADPNVAGELIAEEWVVRGTRLARRETADTINTRANVPCEETAPAGPLCSEVRWRTLESQFEGATPDDLDTFASLRGNSINDPNVPQIADLLDPATSITGGALPVASGPLADVLQPWQAPPPNHGDHYQVYELTGPLTYNSGTIDPATGKFPEGVATGSITVRMWIDSTTQLPIRQTVTAEAPTITSYWTYDAASPAPSALPADFFLVAPPEEASLMQSVTFQGGDAPAVISDDRAATTFTPYTIGDAPTVGGDSLCLAAVLVFEQNEKLDLHTLEEPISSAHDLSSITRVDALYTRRSPGRTCRPGAGDIEEAVLTVSSTARSSGVAGAYHDSLLPRAGAVDPPPQGTPTAFGGVATPALGAGRDAAYVAPGEGRVDSYWPISRRRPSSSTATSRQPKLPPSSRT
jgi:hypothetical protein